MQKQLNDGYEIRLDRTQMLEELKAILPTLSADKLRLIAQHAFQPDRFETDVTADKEDYVVKRGVRNVGRNSPLAKYFVLPEDEDLKALKIAKQIPYTGDATSFRVQLRMALLRDHIYLEQVEIMRLAAKVIHAH